MRLLVSALALVGSLTLAACSPSLGQVEDWAISPQSDRAVIIMDAPPTQPYPVSLSFSKDGNSGFLSRVFQFVAPARTTEPYLARELSPGEYMLTSIVQQSSWGSCFNNGTVAFDLEPGQVYYVGDLNWEDLLTGLQNDARARGRTSLGGTDLATGWDPDIRPAWSYPDEDEMERVREFVSTNMPTTTSPVQPLRAKEVSFEADGAEKAMQICG